MLQPNLLVIVCISTIVTISILMGTIEPIQTITPLPVRLVDLPNGMMGDEPKQTTVDSNPPNEAQVGALSSQMSPLSLPVLMKMGL